MNFNLVYIKHRTSWLVTTNNNLAWDICKAIENMQLSDLKSNIQLKPRDLVCDN